ncbi:MAG: MerR family DNA-binding transcriptional regulator, partial [Patescibacteria group bacterium]
MVQGFAKVYMSHDPAQRNKEIINNSISPRASEGLSVSKAAKILKISPSTLRRLEQNGKIKSTRAANGYRSFSIDEIRKLKVQLDKQDLLEKPELRVLEKQLKTNNNIKPSQKNIPVTEEIKTGQSYKQVIKPKYQLKNFNKLSNALQTATITLILVVILGAFGLKGTDTIKYKTVTNSVKGLLTTTNTSESLLDSDNTEDSAVLAERSQNPLWTFNINVPSTFRQDVQITQNLQIDQNANIDGIVTTPNVTFTGTGTINQLDAIDDITETTLENALDINGDVIGIGLNNVTIVDGAITVNKLADVLEYEGTLSIEGEFLLGGDSGSEGDILTSGGSGIPQWVAPSEINAGQVDGLSGDQFLRSDTSDEFTSGTLSLSNGTFLDLGTIDHTSTSPQGIRLPQSTAFTAPSSGEGYIAWDTASNTLVVYDGSSWSSIQGLFTNSGDLTYLSETTDNLTIGGTTSLAKLGISGDADEIQLLVRGNSTQTTDLVVFEQSDGTNVFSVNNNGTITIPSGQDLVIGSIGLGDTAASTTSGANLIGVYTDIFTNISPVGSDLQSVLETIDSSIGSGSSRWSTTSGTLHPNTLAENLAVGGTSPTAAPFGINVSSNTVYIGDAVTAGNTTLTFKSNSGASTGNLIYNTSDQFQFSGGNVVVDGQLITGSSVINLTTATGYLDADAIQLLNLGTGSTASSSGLEVSSDRIGLLQGCANGEVLKWNEASGLWQCATDSGASSAVVLVEENDVSVGTNVGTLDFINVFSLNESPSGEVNIDIADNALNFTELESALTLDTDTSINFYTGAADANLRYYNSNDATELLFIDGNNGRIGIGNTSPSALLGIGSTNQFTVNSSGAITAATGITSSGNITFSGLSTDGVVTVSSGLLDSEAQLAIARGGTNSTATPTAGAISYGTGTAYGFSTAGTSGQLLQSNGTGAPTWVDSDTVGINYWDRTGTLVTPLTITDNIATLGSIGVGTTNPAAALSVGATSEFRVDSNGNITRINDVAYSFPASQAAAPNYVLTNDGSGNLTWQSVSGVGGITGSGSTGQLTYWNASNSLTGNFNLFWNNSNSRLGIGTSAPATALDINNGNITLSDNYWLGLGTAAGRIEFDNQATDEINFLGANVGIGTSSPSSLLSVGATNQFTVNGSGAITAATGITSSGNITFSGLSTDGVVTVSSGLLGSEAQLAIARGGTNSTATPTAGAIAYGTGTAYGFSSAGTSGQLLQSNGTGAPTWINAASVGTNYWDRTGTLVTPLTITDNVATLGSIGIGTTNPAAALSVGGSSEFRVDTNGNITRINDVAYSFPASQAASDNYVLTNDGSGNLTWESVSGVGGLTGSGNTGQLTYWNAANSIAGNFNFFLDTTNNRLGIGTSAPTSALDINNGNITLSDNYWLGLGTAAGRIEFDNQATDEINFLGANVGIGTSSPSALLSVGAGSQFTVNGSGAVTAATGITSSGNITFSGLSTDGVVTVSSGLLGSEAQLATARGGTNSIATPTAGAISYGTGTAYNFSSAGTSGQLLQSNGTGAPTWINSASVGTNYWDRTGTLVTPLTISDDLASLGNVGIGLTNPIGALHVTGDEVRIGDAGTINFATADGDLYVEDALEVDGSTYLSTLYLAGTQVTSTAAELNLLDGSTAVLGGLVFGNGTYLTQDAANIFWDDSTNRLGIGTTGPQAALSVGATSEFRVDSTGNVTRINDIAYSFPASQAGASNYVLTNDGSGNLTWESVSGVGGLTGSGSTGQATFWNGTNALTGNFNYFWDNNTNRLGIGTSAPQASLSVGSSSEFRVDASGNVTRINDVVYSFPASQATSGNYVLTNDGSGNLTWESVSGVGGLTGSGNTGQLTYWNGTNALTGNFNLFWDTSTNRLGIGTSAPQASLSIGSASEFRVDSNGNVTRINDVAYSFPASQAASDNYVLTNDGSGNLTWESVSGVGGITGAGSNGQLTYWNGANSLTGNFDLFLDSNNSRLGIGTSAPTTALDINNGNITLSDNYWLGLGTSAGRIEFDNQATDEINFLDANVGIGTSSPSALLSVGATNQFTINGSGAITAAAGITSSGNITFSGLSTDGVVTVSSGLLGSEAQLAIARGGTNSTATPTAGAIAYGTGTAYGFSSAGTSGQLLQSNGTGAPTWVNAASVGTNYWDRTGTLVTPLTIADNIATLGSIGVGTTNPAAALSVGAASEFRVDSNGNITRINDVAYSFPASQAAADNYVLTNDGSGNLTWESVSGVGGLTGSGSNGQLTYWNGANSLTGNFNLFLDTSNTRLGIGTSAPTTALDINNGNITLSDNYWLGLGTAAGRIEFDNQATDEINFLGANVGIGTSSPSALLSVGASSQFTVNGSGAITAATGITSSGNITFSGLSTDGVVTVSSGLLGSEAQLAIARGGTNSTATPTAGAISYGTGTAYGFSSAGTSGQLLQSNGTGAPTWVNASSVGTNYWDRTGTLVTPLTITDNIATLGNIGIGTTNPAAVLSVGSTSEFRVDSNGNITRINDVAYSFPASQAAADNYVLTNDGSGNLTWESVSGVGGITGSGNNGQLTFWNGTNSLSGSYGLFLDTSNNYLGIGTSAPNTALDINNGNITLSDNYWLGLGTAAGRVEFDNQATDEINFLGANVGIGTSSPSALLSVGAGNQFTVNGSGAITAATGITSSGNITFSGLSTDGVVTVSSGLLGSEAQLAIARGGTNSTATPTAGAIAYGTGTAYNFSSAGTSGQLLQSNGTGAPTWVNSDTVGINYWDRTGTLVTPLTITDNIATLGNIGIGTTNPAAALSVGSTSEFRVDSNGNITRINDVAYSFPASQAASDNYVLTNDGSGNLTWESVSGVGGLTGSGSTGQLTYWNGANSLTGDFNFFLDSNNARLGIGTSAPTTALDINNGNITLSDNYWLGLGSAAGRIEFDNQATDEINFLGANVGIGTSSPSALLSVGAGNQFTVNGSGAITAATGINSSGNITFSGLSTDGVVTVSSGLLGSEAQLAIARGGTNSTATPTAGAIAYGTGTAYGFSSAGTSGQLLQSNGTGAPTWVNSDSVGVNYWDRTGTLVTPLTITDNIATLGSLGIGNTNPAAALSVGATSEFRVDSNGNITRINDVAYSFPASQAASDNYVLTNDGSGNLTWESVSGIGGITGSGSTGQLTYWNGANSLTGSFNLFLDANNTRLGIGTSAPTTALDINNGNITLSDNYWLGLGTNAGRIEFDNQATDEINFLSANVGIGTSSPSALLSVGATNQFTVNSSGAITAAAGITSSGNITFSGLSTDGVVTVSSGLLGSEAQLAIARGGTNSTATPTAGAIAYGTGTAYNFSSAGTSGQLLQSNGTGAPTWVNASSVGTNYWDRTGTLVTPLTITDNIATFGSIGIGTTNPTGALQATGDEVRIGDAGTINFATADGDLYIEDALEVDGSTYLSTLYLAGAQVTSTAAEINLLDGSTAVEGGLVFGNGTYLTQDSANIFWDNSTKRLGIGTTGPQAALSVGATSEFRVDSNGNVTRINDVAYSFPASQAAGSSYVLSNDGSGNLTWESVAGVGAINGSGSTGQITYFNGASDVTGSFNLFWDGSTNRLGIGTSAPVTALDISNGNITLSDNYWLGLGTSAGRVEFDNQATDEINFLGANVGIGTSSPSALLSVGAGSQFTVNGSGAVTAATGITSSGNITFSGLSTDGVVTVSSGLLGSEAQLAIARGGTNSTATPTAGAIAYGTGTAYNFSSAGTSGQLLQSNGTGAPTWVNATSNYWDRTGTLVTPLTITDNVATLGNIGIGTTNPAADLDVGGGTLTAADGTSDILVADDLEVDGQIFAADGTAALPGYAFQSDTNTGIFRGGADNLRLTTGGAEALTADSLGNIGIGTTVINYQLDILSSDTTGGLRVVADSVTTGTGALFSFDGLSTGTGLSLASTSTAF